MTYWLDIRLKIARFFRKHKRKIIIILIIWSIIIMINYYLKYRQKVILPQTTYEPHSPVIDKTDKVPEKLKEPISNLIKDFVENCNNKNYDAAYDLLSEEYKARYYPSIDKFKEHIDEMFPNKKIYNIQDFSNLNNTYVYRVRLLDDILTDGTTDGYSFTEEKYVLKEENGNLKISLDGYCGSQDLGIEVEDEYMEIKIEKKYITYDETSYVITIRNKTNNFILISDKETYNGAIQLKLPNDTRTAKYMANSNFVILPNETKTEEFQFTEYFDDKQEPTNLLLNSIRILPKYTGDEEKAQEENENAIKLYSLSIDLIPKERK